MNKKYYESVDILKIILLIFVIISSYTLVNTTGVPVISMLSFSVGTFYLLFGYFVLRDGEDISERIKRSIRRTAIAFVVAAVVYFALICLILLIAGGRVTDLFNKKTIFDFFVLNIWAPTLGGNIWIIHALLYALIIFYFLQKWKLLKYDMHIMIALFVIAVLFGEGAGLIRFHVRSYTYIGGNFLTRAMPYMLLGRIMYKARSRKAFRKMKNWMWAVIFVVGIALTFIEMIALVNANRLVYLNHMIGFIPMAFAASMFFLNMKRKFSFGKYCADIGKAGFYIYSVVAQVIYLLVINLFKGRAGTILAFLGVITVIITLALATIYARLKYRRENPPESEESTNEASV